MRTSTETVELKLTVNQPLHCCSLARNLTVATSIYTRTIPRFATSRTLESGQLTYSILTCFLLHKPTLFTRICPKKHGSPKITKRESSGLLQYRPYCPQVL